MTWKNLREELDAEFAHFTWRVHDIDRVKEWLNTQRRARAREASKFRVRTRPSAEQRKVKRERERRRYHTEPGHRAKKLGYHKGWFQQNKTRTYQRERTRYHTDAEYRARKIEAGRAAYQRIKADPKRWARLLEQIRKSKASRRAAK